jgi:TolB-like protein/class 3 adenylate cyclase
MTETRKLAAILAADIAGYSWLMGQDEATTVRALKAHQAVVLPMVGEFEGTIVDTAGDGILAHFPSAVRAVECAIAVQRIMAERNRDVPADRRMVFRVGVNLGDVIYDAARVYGDGVNIAARLEGIARPGAICLSEDTYRQVRGKLDLAVTDLGPLELKNIAEPVRVYELQPDGSAPGRSAARSGHATAERSSPPLVPDKPSIAVLAFENMSGDGEQEYFSDGIAEDIITDLSKLSELHVIARNSSFVYKKTAVNVPDVAKALGVRYLLEGSVRKAGNRVRVTAQLIDAGTGGHLWASRYDRDLTDIFTVQDELTREIVTALKLKLTVHEQDRLRLGRSRSVAEYEYYLRAREAAMKGTKSGNVAVRELAGAAVAIDPHYGAAHALIAFSHLNDYSNGQTSDPEQSLRDGIELAQRVVDMDQEDPAGHFVLGVARVWTRDLDAAEAEARRGLAISPNFADLMVLMANIKIYSGDPAAALESMDAAMRLDPHHPEIWLQIIADAQFSQGDYPQAVATLERRLARNPQSWSANALLASCYGHLGRPADGLRAWKEVMRINPGLSVERRRRVLPFRNPADFERRVEGLRKAGVAV